MLLPVRSESTSSSNPPRHLIHVRQEFSKVCLDNRGIDIGTIGERLHHLGLSAHGLPIEVFVDGLIRKKLKSCLVRIENLEICRIVYGEAVILVGYPIVLLVPATGALRRQESGLSFSEDLSDSVRLAPDRVVPEKKSNGENSPTLELYIVTAKGKRYGSGIVLPAFSLKQIKPAAALIVRKVFGRIHALNESVIRGREIQDAKVNAVVPEAIDPSDGILQRAV
jgi:hypothetical protein